jgi:hypothetical protein
MPTRKCRCVALNMYMYPGVQYRNGVRGHYLLRARTILSIVHACGTIQRAIQLPRFGEIRNFSLQDKRHRFTSALVITICSISRHSIPYPVESDRRPLELEHSEVESRQTDTYYANVSLLSNGIGGHKCATRCTLGFNLLSIRVPMNLPTVYKTRCSKIYIDCAYFSVLFTTARMS